MVRMEEKDDAKQTHSPPWRYQKRRSMGSIWVRLRQNRRKNGFVVVSFLAMGACAAPRLLRNEPKQQEMPVSAKLFRVILPVSNLQKAADFYAAVLDTPGMKVSDGRHYFDCGGTILACFSPKEDGDSCEPRPNQDHLYFAVDDLEATYQRCLKAGAAFAEGEVHGDPAGAIAHRPWGERSFYIKDPFGNPICFVDRKTVYTGP